MLFSYMFREYGKTEFIKILSQSTSVDIVINNEETFYEHADWYKWRKYKWKIDKKK